MHSWLQPTSTLAEDSQFNQAAQLQIWRKLARGLYHGKVIKYNANSIDAEAQASDETASKKSFFFRFAQSNGRWFPLTWNCADGRTVARQAFYSSCLFRILGKVAVPPAGPAGVIVSYNKCTCQREKLKPMKTQAIRIYRGKRKINDALCLFNFSNSFAFEVDRSRKRWVLCTVLQHAEFLLCTRKQPRGNTTALPIYEVSRPSMPDSSRGLHVQHNFVHIDTCTIHPWDCLCLNIPRSDL